MWGFQWSWISDTKIEVWTCNTTSAIINASNIPISLTTGSGYSYYKANYWINGVIDSWGHCTSSNRDLSGSRGDAPTWTKTFWDISLQKGDVLEIGYTLTNTPASASIWPFSISYQCSVTKEWDHYWIPLFQKNIWEMSFINITWVSEWIFYLWKETNSATVWEIAPWNFVGYIQIWKYKIPYYL